jgi:hypothetical protein
MLGQYIMNSSFDNSNGSSDNYSIGPDKPTTKSRLKCFASRANPSKQYPRVTFKKCSDLATMPTSEKPFVTKGPSECTAARKQFGIYQLRAVRGTDPGIEPTLDMFSIVNKTDALIGLHGKCSTTLPSAPTLAHAHRPARPASTLRTRSTHSH